MKSLEAAVIQLAEGQGRGPLGGGNMEGVEDPRMAPLETSPEGPTKRIGGLSLVRF